jgi:hypothetical protein
MAKTPLTGPVFYDHTQKAIPSEKIGPASKKNWSKIFGAIYVNAKCNLRSWPTISRENMFGTPPLDMRTIN